jgi:hypothetical protein
VTTDIKPLFLSDLVDIARAVHGEQQRHQHSSRVEPHERFLTHLSYRGHHVDHELWEGTRALVGWALGPPNSFSLFAFPYPDLVVAALAIEGRSDDGSNMVLDFLDQRDIDYPDGTCTADCPATPVVGHSHPIIAAYSRAGWLAHWLEQVVKAAGLLAIEAAFPPAETPEKG